ncbi:MAG: methyltransferase [Alphaproteobacteria bacterium]|nr:methyltransferase [Alphaproteobacteria bacterium]
MLAETTRDAILGGRVTIVQPAQGYRAAIDPVLLAAAIPAQPGEAVLDAGSGTGAASLALAARCDGVSVTGLEAQDCLVGLARDGAVHSGFEGRVRFVAGDLLVPPAELTAGSFDHVMANPPYMAAGRGNPPPDAGKRAATVEGEAALKDWLEFCLSRVRDGGTVTVIHRFERTGEITAGLSNSGAGGLIVFPVLPQTDKAAKRVIVQARKGAQGDIRTKDGLVLHEIDGGFTPAAEAILRDARALSL